VQTQQTRSTAQPPPALLGASGGPPPLRRRDAATGEPGGDAGAGAGENLPPAAAPSPAPAQSRLYSMAGNVASIDCTKDPEVSLTLVFGGLTMKLHANNLKLVRLLGPDGTPQSGALTCTQLRNAHAQISYALLPGGPYDGEIAAIKPNP
jgi:hypothetical protein